MGIDPFVASTKMPKQRLSAEERLRRLEEAKEFLRQHLTPEPMPACALIKDAKAVGIANRTLHRAKDMLGVQVQRQGWGKGGQWLWAAPCGQESAVLGATLIAGWTIKRSS